MNIFEVTIYRVISKCLPLGDIGFQETKKPRVTLVHDKWDKLGIDAQSSRDGYDGGWASVFEECFVKAC